VEFQTAAREAKERIKTKLDIVQLIGEHVPLKRTGRSYKGLCPFHDEKTPSFIVFPESQHFKCFGCGVGGDVFTFIMEREKLAFREALELLAERTGVQLPRASASDVRAKNQRLGLIDVLGKAHTWFVDNLSRASGTTVAGYVEQRGLGPAVTTFGLGYAPGAAPGRMLPNGLVDYLRAQGANLGDCVQLGLIGRTESGNYYDRFRNRLMFPIRDERGRIVGFGGRILPGHESEREPKYLNSPESPVFNKRHVLYGLYEVRQHETRSRASGGASTSRGLIVMEGYTDVIAAHLGGVPTAVATLGTSLTREHTSLLRRFAPDGVTLLFDGDRAGKSAAERAFASLTGELVPARIGLLPEGRDPADVVQTDGREGLELVVEEARDALDVWLDLVRERLDVRTHEGKVEAANACRELLKGVDDPLRRDDLAQRIANALVINPEHLRPRVHRARSAEPAPRSQGPARDRVDQVQDLVLAALYRSPELLEALEDELHGPSFESEGDPLSLVFPRELPRNLVDCLREMVLDTGVDPSSGELLKAWMNRVSGDSTATAYVLRLVDLAEIIEDPELPLRDGVMFHRRRVLLSEVDRLRNALREALADVSQGDPRAIETEYNEAVRRARRLGVLR
jgi:DNA primase